MPTVQPGPISRLAMCVISGALVVSCGGETGPQEEPLSSGPTTTVDGDFATSAAAESTTTLGEAQPSTDPCVIAEPEMVREAFGGEALGEMKIGVTCRYGLEGGAVDWADVVWIGLGSEWEEIKSRYAETRGGIIEVDVLGVEGFHPVDHGVRDLVFRSGENVYAVLVLGGPTPDTLAALGEAVLALAEGIVALER
ncbi:hypothetical protein BH23ACT4_BH23ACT4_15880 [soil metagenome]